MGVLNITPDSFSDGGQFITPERALAQAKRMIAEGADIIDIGAESTRPYGAEPISADEELKRLQPILAEIVSLGIPVSIDSMKSTIVAWALERGATIANNVWGLQRDGDMAGLLAGRGCPVIIVHNRERADADMDIVKDISEFFGRSLDIAARAGICRENIVLDPGIGFGKTAEHNLTLLAHLEPIVALGFPVVLGVSRKRFIGAIDTSAAARAGDRLGGSVAAALAGARAGVAVVRVHDVRETRQALAVQAAIEAAG